ncbi:MAG: RNA-binding protein [Phycisphaerales bacterium]|nr:RNA-binding protein [Phycisphaerales bacterium]
MANKSLFASIRGIPGKPVDAINEAGGTAYQREPRQALAQLAVTGCLNGAFYADASTQLASILALCEGLPPEYVARTALYARQRGFMKDVPALLTAILSVRGPGLMAEIFDRVIDSPRMLRTFVQIMRSGAVGRKSLGTLPRRLITQWLAKRSDRALFDASVGRDPSLADVIRLVHPKPETPARRALLGYLLGRPHDASLLPETVRAFEAYKAAADRSELRVPDVPFQMLTALNLGPRQWREIASRAPWQTTRINLNTFARHGVFQDSELRRIVADRLRDRAKIAAARAMPYQLLTAFQNADAQVPLEVREALQDAMEIAIENVPTIEGRTYVLVDVSGSMHSSITGTRPGATSAVRCIDVAALVAAAVLRRNPLAEVIPFEADVVSDTTLKLNPRDSVMTNATRLAALPSGGTNCAAPLGHLNRRKAVGDLVIYVSDNQSWIETALRATCGSTTATMQEWSAFKRRSPAARLVCIDVQPYGTTQMPEQRDVINVGGFSDAVFDVLAAVSRGGADPDAWVRVIDEVRI